MISSGFRFCLSNAMDGFAGAPVGAANASKVIRCEVPLLFKVLGWVPHACLVLARSLCKRMCTCALDGNSLWPIKQGRAEAYAPLCTFATLKPLGVAWKNGRLASGDPGSAAKEKRRNEASSVVPVTIPLQSSFE